MPLNKLVPSSIMLSSCQHFGRVWNRTPFRCFFQLRHIALSSHRLNQPQHNKNEIVSSSDRHSDGQVSTTVHKVKETAKTTTYGGIMLLGVGVTGALFYAIFNELFSGKSPNSVYSKALDRCIADDRIAGSLGEPIKGYGEETRRGRRRHVSHVLYSKDGVDYLRMKFYLKGSRRKATVQLEMKENSNGKYDYRYLFVQLDDYPNSVFVLEDNREKDQLVPLDNQLPELE